jgi:hypothetical protein
VQHLGGVEERVDAEPRRGVVVARDEGPHGLHHLLQRSTGHRHETRTQQIGPAHLPDDVGAVREGVQANRIHVEHAPVRRVEREDSGVPVANAGQGREAHQPDEQLVVIERVRPATELVHRLLEARRREVVEEVRVVLPQVPLEEPHVTGASALGVRAAARPASREDEERRDHGGPPHQRFRLSFLKTSSAQANEARARA